MTDLENEIHKKFTKKLLNYLILRFLNSRPMHGYELISNIRKEFGVYFSPSTVYPLLATIEQKGYISSIWNMESDRPRKIYTLTPTGHNVIVVTESTLSAIIQKIDELADGDPVPSQE